MDTDTPVEYDNEAARQRFKEMPLEEFRRRVDLAVSYVRDLRQGITAATGMVLEHVDRAIPVLDKENAEAAFNQIMEMLPLIRLSPEERAERAKRAPISEEQREATERALEAMIEMDPDEFNECMKESELPFTHEDLLGLQEEGEKIRLLGLVQDEVSALVPALLTLRETLADRAREILSGAFQRAGFEKAAGGRGGAN
jgi:hypothetical protein